VVAPSLTTVLSVRGTQSAPVRAVSLNHIGIRDTAPTIMFPHVGPSVSAPPHRNRAHATPKPTGRLG
jgi:hypothetical protein